MIKRSIFLTLALNTLAIAGQIKSVDFIYTKENFSGALRNLLEVNVKTDGNCLIKPVKEKGKEIEIEFNNCQSPKVYSIERRGSFINKAILKPINNNALLKVDLAKPGTLKVLEEDSGFKIKIYEGYFINPKISVTKTSQGEKIVIKLPKGTKPEFNKVGNKLIIDIPKVSFEPFKREIPSDLVEKAELKTLNGKGLIELSLSPKVVAAQTTTEGNNIHIVLYSSKNTAQKSQEPKITLHFTNADVRSVIKEIARIANINVVFHPEVNGKVNIDFKKPVYWKDALKAILSSLNLSFIKTPEYYEIIPKYLEPIHTYVVHLQFANAEELAEKLKTALNLIEVKTERERKLNLGSRSNIETESESKLELESELRKEGKRNSKSKSEYRETRSEGEKEKTKLSRESKLIETSNSNVYNSTHTKKEKRRNKKNEKNKNKNKIEKGKVIEDNITREITEPIREEITFDKDTNSLILKVTQSHYQEIRKLISALDRPRKQVLVRAKIVQIRSSAEKDLGLSWYISGYNRLGDSTDSTYLASTYGFNISSYTPLITPDTYMKLSKMPVSDNTLALGILNKTQTMKVELALKALELEGNAQTISSPNVLTLDNEEATIEQGIEIPYTESTVGAGGTTSYNIKFRKASLILRVKPHIADDGKMILELEVRKDSPNYEHVTLTGSNEPAINTRNVKSKVIIKNGHTVVIGGIYEKEKFKSTKGVPGLSRIPLLGWLFRDNTTKVSKSQLLIFITPTIVDSEGTETLKLGGKK